MSISFYSPGDHSQFHEFHQFDSVVIRSHPLVFLQYNSRLCLNVKSPVASVLDANSVANGDNFQVSHELNAVSQWCTFNHHQFDSHSHAYVHTLACSLYNFTVHILSSIVLHVCFLGEGASVNMTSVDSERREGNIKTWAVRKSQDI